MKRCLLLLATAALLAGAGITAAVAATSTDTVSIGNCTTEGQYVSCSVQGDIAHPASISVQVWASPEQAIDVSWDDLCSAGFTSGDRSGDFTVTASASHKVTRRIPLAAGHKGTCTPDVLVSADGTGRIHVVLSGEN